MSVLLSKATGSWTDATATWGLVDATSYLNAESSTESLLTTDYSGTRSSAFTPGAITVEGIAVKLCERIGTTGTISVSLRNSTLGLDDFVTGTEVTINVSNLPSCLEADLNGGWIYFKFATPVLLITATAYNVQAKTSSATQVDLFCDGTADNLSRALVTTTEQAPTTGDDVIITKSWTAADTGTDVVITMNETASTDYGSAPTAANSLIQPGIAVCQGGTLRVGTTAATTYLLKMSNSIIVYSSGTWEEGTTGTPMPRDSSFELTFDCGANVDYGFTARNLSTYTRQGQSRTSAKLVYKCLLNTDEAAAQTVLGVDTDTGWLNGDEVIIVSTTRTASETERRTLTSSDATTITVSSGLTNAHSGTSPTQAEVLLLTRNVRMHGASASLQAYVDIKATATVDWDWAQTYWMGSATSTKRGIDIGTTTGSLDFRYCSVHDFAVASSVAQLINAATANNFSVKDHVVHGCLGSGGIIGPAATTGTSWTLDNIYISGCVGNAISVTDVGGTITNIYAVGNPTTGTTININELGGIIGTISGINGHSNTSSNILIGANGGTIGGVITSWRSAGFGLTFSTTGNLTVASVNLFGNTTTNLVLISNEKLVILDGDIAGDTTFATTNGVSFTGGGSAEINSVNFGVTAGIRVAHSRDILPAAGVVHNLTLNSCVLGSSTEILTPSTLMHPGQVFASQKHDGTSGNNMQTHRTGVLVLDTTADMYDVTPSARITPSIATEDFKFTIGSVNVASGEAATPSVKVRESVTGDGTDYNGSRIKLYVKKNFAIGITSDTLLDTATVSSEGAFETLTGATAAASEDGVMEFYITCNGTTGWINVDTLTVTVA